MTWSLEAILHPKTIYAPTPTPTPTPSPTPAPSPIPLPTSICLANWDKFYFAQTSVQTVRNALAYGNGRFIAVNNSSKDIEVSTDGATWTRHPLPEALPATYVFRNAGFAGGYFIIAGFDNSTLNTGGSNTIIISADGINWQSIVLPTNGVWSSIATANQSAVLISNASNKAVFTDDGGLTWSIATLPKVDLWQSVTYGLGLYVAVAQNSDKVAVSADYGATWSEYSLPNSAAWSSITYGKGKFVLAAFNSNSLLYSFNGQVWNSTTLPSTLDTSVVTYGNDYYLLIADGGLAYKSTDALTWTQLPLSDGGRWSNVVYGNNSFIAIPLTGNYLNRSTCQLPLPCGRSVNDTFTNTEPAGIRSMALGLNTIVALQGSINNPVASGSYYISQDSGQTWNITTTLPSTKVWDSVVFGNNLFLMIASDDANSGSGAVISSQDGITWTTVLSNFDYINLRFVNGRFYAFSTSINQITSSIDGVNWQTITVPNVSINMIYGNNKYVLQTTNNLYSSDDTNTWTVTNIQGSPSSISYGNGKFVAFNIVDEVMFVCTSSNGSVWDSVRTDFYPSIVPSRSTSFGNSMFLKAIGDVILGSQDAVTWYRIGTNFISNTNFDSIAGDGYFIIYNTDSARILKLNCTSTTTTTGTVFYNKLLFSSGLNSSGQLGLGNTTNKNQFTAITATENLRRFMPSSVDYGEVVGGCWLPFVFHGYDHVILGIPVFSSAANATTTVGTMRNWLGFELYAYGNNDRGQLGISGSIGGYVDTPTKVSSNLLFKTVRCGYKYTIAVGSDETSVYGWGANDSGQLGVGDYDDRPTPSQVAITGAIHGIATGKSATFITISDGRGSLYANSLYGFGSNAHGQLGLNIEDTTYKSFTPLKISTLENTTISNIFGGCLNEHFMLSCLDGSLPNGQSTYKLFVWGNNTNGQCGQNTSGADIKNIGLSNPDLPGTAPFVAYGRKGGDFGGCGEKFTAIAATSATISGIILAGSNDRGQLAVPTIAERSSFELWSYTGSNVYDIISVGPDFVITNNRSQTTGINKFIGWGDNSYGQLDNGPNAATSYYSVIDLTQLFEIQRGGSDIAFGINGQGYGFSTIINDNPSPWITPPQPVLTTSPTPTAPTVPACFSGWDTTNFSTYTSTLLVGTITSTGGAEVTTGTRGIIFNVLNYTTHYQYQISIYNQSTQTYSIFGSNGIDFKVGDTIFINMENFLPFNNWTYVNGTYQIVNITSTYLILECPIAIASGNVNLVYTSPTPSCLTCNWRASNTISSSVAIWANPLFGNNNFVVAGYDSNTNISYTAVSEDNGLNWTVHALPTFTALSYVPGYFGRLSTTSPTDELANMVFADGRFLTIARDFVTDDTYIATSTDGKTWTQNAYDFGLTSARDCVGVAYINGIYIAAFSSATAPTSNTIYIIRSTDGITWDAPYTLTSAIAAYPLGEIKKIFVANDKFFLFPSSAGASKKFYVSSNGTDWTLVTLPTTESVTIKSMIYDGTRYAMINYFAISSGPFTQQLWTSADGITNWQETLISTYGQSVGGYLYYSGEAIFTSRGQNPRYSINLDSFVLCNTLIDNFTAFVPTQYVYGNNTLIATQTNNTFMRYIDCAASPVPTPSPTPSPTPTPAPTPTPSPTPTPTPQAAILLRFFYDNLGEQVAVSGDGLTIIGIQKSLNYDTVYVFKYVNAEWILVQEINHENINNTIVYYKMSCDINTDGSKFIVGYTNETACRAYIYALNNNNLIPSYRAEAILDPSDYISSISDFGFSVALSESGDRALVSLPRLPFPKPSVVNVATNAGYLYYYKRINNFWILDHDIRVAEPLPNDYLGALTSTDFSGRTSTAIAGLRNRNKVALFDLTAPSILNPDNQTNEDSFSSSMAISSDGSTLIITAPRRTQDSGYAYAYLERSDSIYYDYNEFTSADSSANDMFGSSVALSRNNNLLAIGAENAEDKGAIFIFNGTGKEWSQSLSFISPTTYKNRLGASITMSPDNTFIYAGAPSESPAGAVYAYYNSSNQYAFNQTIVPFDAESIGKAEFGYSLSVSYSGSDQFDKLLFVGSPNRNDGIGGVYVYGSRGTNHDLLTFIDNPTPANGPNSFGWSIAASSDGSFLFVGAPFESDSLGVVHVFIKEVNKLSWQLSATLSPNLVGQFGHSLFLTPDDNYLYIGAPYTDFNKKQNTGIVYVYKRESYSGNTKYVLHGILSSPEPDSNELFGHAMVATNDGKKLIVGAPGSLNNRGTAYAFNDTEMIKSVLVPPNIGIEAEFGSSIASDKEAYRVLVGAPYQSTNGRIYYYKRESATWVLKQEISPVIATKPTDGYFGYSIDNDEFMLAMVSGVPNFTTTISNSGVALVYENIQDVWNLAHQVYPEDPQVDGYFGQSVAMSGDSYMLAVGAPGMKNNNDSPVGAIYLFYAGTGSYVQIAKFMPDNLTTKSNFGTACSMTKDGTRLIVGAPDYELDGVANIGTVYVYELDAGQWVFKQQLYSGLNAINGLYAPQSYGKNVKFGKTGQIAVVSSSATISDVITAGDIFIYRNDSMNNLILESHITVPFDALGPVVGLPDFGFSISISDDERTIVVGVPGDNPNGSAIRYDYINNLWIMTAKYELIFNSAADIGRSVFVSADKKYILAGANKANPSGSLVVFSAD